MNKSEQIRQLHDQGYKVQQIADKLGIRYQFAYNVVSHYVKTKEVKIAKQEVAPSQDFSLWRWIVGRA